MVGIGGVTRVTKSGLSITEWKPITGAILPLNENQWMEEFKKYQQIPEFHIENKDMTLSGFKSIFYVEYFHRLFARIIFFVCVVPLLYFFYKKLIDRRFFLRLFGIFSLIGLQGLVGWYMVKSGLTQRTSVNEIWLASHLCFALLIFSLIFWQGLKVKYSAEIEKNIDRANHIFLFIMTFILLPFQFFFGGVVAGLHILSMCYQNLDQICSFKFLDVVKYQESLPLFWAHKLFAFILFFGIVALLFSTLKEYKVLVKIVLFLLILQVGLGISVIFLNSEFYGIKYLAVFHQVNGFLLYGSIFYGLFLKRYGINSDV
jgi:cytochrome c oxidase assembly protein subunit 15